MTASCGQGENWCDITELGNSRCYGSQRQECHYKEGHSYEWVPVDCASVVGPCSSCPVLSDESCVYPTESVCRDNQVMPCIHGKVNLIGAACEGLTVCREGTSEDGVNVGFCALDEPPCDKDSDVSWECRDGARVECAFGHPVARVTCQGPRGCVEDDGVAMCAGS